MIHCVRCMRRGSKKDNAVVAVSVVVKKKPHCGRRVRCGSNKKKMHGMCSGRCGEKKNAVSVVLVVVKKKS